MTKHTPENLVVSALNIAKMQTNKHGCGSLIEKSGAVWLSVQIPIYNIYIYNELLARSS